MSNIVHKVKEALHSDKHPETGSNTGYNDREGTHGPHGSRVANAADPRVDSDRDHRAAPGAYSSAGNTAGTGTYGSSGAYGSTGTGAGAGVTGYNDPEGTHGPHGSRVANAADPRIDSDRDHRGAPGAGFGDYSNTGSTTTGGAHVTGYNDPAGTHGPHGSRIANAADPRIDSDRDHRGAPGGAGTAHYGSGPGPAANTAGPHGNDLLNKADPRVDSDLDGSKTFGGNKTFS